MLGTDRGETLEKRQEPFQLAYLATHYFQGGSFPDQHQFDIGRSGKTFENRDLLLK